MHRSKAFDVSATIVLVFSQVYPPDSASVGQHLADVAEELASRGHRVSVVTSRRGYDDPSRTYPPRELVNGVHIRRVPLSSFGKQSFALRALAMMVFTGWCIWFGITTRRLGAIVVSTTPPLVGLAARLVGAVRRAPFVYWEMDLNPDQLIAMGMIRDDSLVARALVGIERNVLEGAGAVVTLDRFMAERLTRKLDLSAKMEVFPPWPHNLPARNPAHTENRFRDEHGLQDRFIVMFSGNHGHSTPVTALLAAAALLADEPRIVFVFIGGGVRKQEVDEFVATHRPENVLSLPYQPLTDLEYSLSAADLHLVTVDADLVGIVHPCKVYGAMAAARPVLLLGPEKCHVSDLIHEHAIGWRVSDESPEEIAEAVRRISHTDREELDRMGRRGSSAIDCGLNRQALCGRFCDIVERQIDCTLEPRQG